MGLRPFIRRRPRSAIAPSTRQYIESAHVARTYDAYFRFTHLFRYDVAVLDEAFAEPGRLIDLGCGTGRHLLHFARRGFAVTGVDLSDHMLEMARMKLRSHGFEATLVKDDITDLGALPDGGFRYALLMFSTLGLIRGRNNRLRCLRRVHRILKPGGQVGLHVHNRWHNLWSDGTRGWFLANLFAPLTSGREIGDKVMANYRGIPGMFLHLFSLREIRGLLRQAGFIVDRAVCLNRVRDGELEGSGLRSWRANGFIVLAHKPDAG